MRRQLLTAAVVATATLSLVVPAVGASASAASAASGPGVGPAAAPTDPPTPSPAPTPRPRPVTPPVKPPVKPPNHAPTTWPLHPADHGALVALVQQRLAWLGYPVPRTRVMDRATLAAVRTFRVKFGLGRSDVVTGHVWSVLNRINRNHGVLPSACRAVAIALCVDKTQKSLRLVRHGVVVLTVDARFGGPATPTREGVFRVFSKSRDHVSSEFHTPMPFAMFFSGGQAVHYSPFFHRDGYAGHSHGCVNLRDRAVAALLFSTVPYGTRVVVYHS